jgi:hypothetical protein
MAMGGRENSKTRLQSRLLRAGDVPRSAGEALG